MRLLRALERLTMPIVVAVMAAAVAIGLLADSLLRLAGL